MTDRETSHEANERAHLEASRAALEKAKRLYHEVSLHASLDKVRRASSEALQPANMRATEEFLLGLKDVKSIFPAFDINVPMPADTAVPGSYGTDAQETSTGTFFRRRKRTTD